MQLYWILNHPGFGSTESRRAVGIAAKGERINFKATSVSNLYAATRVIFPLLAAFFAGRVAAQDAFDRCT